jgi:hypothetical protein
VAGSSTADAGNPVPPPLTRTDTSVTETASIGGAPAVVRQQRRDTVKRVTGLRIEFKTEEERDGFVDATKRAQERCLPLPEKI